MHGPCESVIHWCPKFGDGAAGTVYITVIDDVAKTIRPLHRLVWRTARDKALALWAQAGIGFTVEEGPGESYDFLNSTDDLTVLVIPKTIRILRNINNRPPGTFAPEDFAWYDGDKDGSVAVYTPHSIWWKRYWLPSLVSLVCHELGHCLGLWHRTDHGVMAGGSKPDAHDLDSIRAYYL